MQKTIRQIRVDGHLTGVVGLDEAIRQVAQSLKDSDEAEITQELLRRIAGKNYIPDKLRPAYGAAIIREYKKYLGQGVEEDCSDDLRVIILGGGCLQCESLESGVRDVMAEMDLVGEIINITDAKEIGRYGVMGVPALVMNNKVVSVGVVPDKKKIRQWLKEALENSGMTSSR